MNSEDMQSKQCSYETGVAGDWREEWRSRPNSIPPRAWLAQVNHCIIPGGWHRLTLCIIPGGTMFCQYYEFLFHPVKRRDVLVFVLVIEDTVLSVSAS